MRTVEERNKIVENNMSIVPYVISKEYSSYIGDEDMMQEGYIGLIDAADKWNPSVGCPFVVFAMICIKSAITREITRRSAEKRSLMFEVSLYEKRFSKDSNNGDSEESTIELKDTIRGVQDVDYFYIDEFLKLLTEKEREILELLYSGYNKIEIAEINGVSHQAISASVRSIGRKWNSFYKENNVQKGARRRK